ncbi:translation initiation factor IF-2-like [Aquila chrysaetos chrysaetos]|uniref:translation initiation factor IF-2-like n=1 Tax=Aquila chrysaetos chrysaetos TaxID=223781 RepID=UPI001B7D3159|nr:translation initiation factor IF-2-like [Aquila chrysaetos chrysaetos]
MAKCAGGGEGCRCLRALRGQAPRPGPGRSRPPAARGGGGGGGVPALPPAPAEPRRPGNPRVPAGARPGPRQRVGSDPSPGSSPRPCRQGRGQAVYDDDAGGGPGPAGRPAAGSRTSRPAGPGRQRRRALAGCEGVSAPPERVGPRSAPAGGVQSPRSCQGRAAARRRQANRGEANRTRCQLGPFTCFASVALRHGSSGSRGLGTPFLVLGQWPGAKPLTLLSSWWRVSIKTNETTSVFLLLRLQNSTEMRSPGYLR